jgi:probable HAF family extracellular repeat protein
MSQIRSAIMVATVALFASTTVQAQDTPYTYTNLGKPTGADSPVGVRMNNKGHVAGWSLYYGQGEPSLKGWVWTPRRGFTILPPPPGFFLGRSRAMDINDNGVVAGDGGYDIGLAWRYENGEYTVTGSVQGMPGAYLGGINEHGDVAGTAKDGSFTTPDYAFVDIHGGPLLSITPGGGRATDVNNNGQVCGYLDPLSGPFEAFRWDEAGGVQPLGTLGLAFSYGLRMNDAGDVVGYALSASGNTSRAWIYTDAQGMQTLPAPYLNASTAVSINNRGHVVGISQRSGLDLNWLWTGGDSVTDIATLFNPVGENVNLISVLDINNAGQILVRVFDNNVAEFRTAILTPPVLTGDPNAADPDDATGIEPGAGIQIKP